MAGRSSLEGSVRRARDALTSRDFKRLVAGRFLGQFGDGLFQAYLVAQLVFLNPDKQHTAVGVAKATALLVVPFSIVAPFAGVLIDRWARRTILVEVPLLRAASALPLAFLHGSSGVALYVPVIVVVSLNRFLLAAAGAVNPLLVRERDLLVANALTSIGGTFVYFAGLVVGTKLAGPLGTHGLIVVTAAFWPVSSLVFRSIRRPLRMPRPDEAVSEGARRALGELWSGVRRLGATPGAIGPITSIAVDQLMVGVATVLSVVVFREQFKEGVGSYGNIIAAGGVGVFVGMITVGWFEPRLPKPKIVAVAFAVAGLVCAAAAPHLSGPVIVAVSFSLGLTYPWMKAPADTMVQEAIPDRFRGRVFSVYDLCFSAARVIAALLAVPIISGLSPGWTVALLAALFLLWTPVLPRWARRAQRVGLRAYAGAMADEEPRAIVVGGEEEPVEVVRSWLEERGGERLRCFRLRTADGTILDVSRTVDGEEPWRVDREIPAAPEDDRG